MTIRQEQRLIAMLWYALAVVMVQLSERPMVWGAWLLVALFNAWQMWDLRPSPTDRARGA